MYMNLPPRTTEEHVSEVTTRVERLERRIPQSSIELYVQAEPPTTAGYGAFWLDTAP